MADQSQNRPQALDERLVIDAGYGLLALDRAGRVLFANRSARETLRLSGDPEGRDVARVLEAWPALARAASEALAAPGGSGIEEVRLLIDDEPRSLVVRRTPLRRGESTEGVILSIVDLTALRATEARERRAAALAGLRRLTHHLAHELKNPLGALKLYTLLLERQQRDGRASSAELVEKVARAVDHLSAVVGETTELAPTGPFEPTAVVLGQVVDRCLTNAQERLRSAAIHVARHGGDGSVTVSGDSQALGRAISALLDNAIEAMPGGGRLTIGIAPRPPRERGPEVELTIRDSGPGIPEEVRARLFEPFVTTKEGTGLGMAIAHEVIEKHGGRMDVQSQAGQGTTVRVVLPAGKRAENHA